MEGINTGKLIVSGIVAGVVITISQMVLNLGVLGGAQDAALEAMGVAPVGGAQIGMFVAMTFVASCTMMWLYASLRDRLGAGPGPLSAPASSSGCSTISRGSATSGFSA